MPEAIEVTEKVEKVTRHRLLKTGVYFKNLRLYMESSGADDLDELRLRELKEYAEANDPLRRKPNP